MHRLIGKLMVITVVLFVITIILGTMLPMVERQDARANIITIYDGLWYSVSTITSVGYGDHFPITSTGRMIGFFLIIFGSSTFFVFTSLIAAALLLRETKKDHIAIMNKLTDLETKLEKMHLKSSGRQSK